MKLDLIDAALRVGDFLAGLVPGALGAIVATAYEKGLTWGQRFLQLAVGIVVSYYVGAAFSAVFGASDFLRQGVSFTAGMIAYKAVPVFIQNWVSTAAEVPGDLWSAVKAKIGIKE